jgi:hypothetical protein
MKQDFDQEIDALLRRKARLAAGPLRVGAARSTSASSHLDADELSAFAENALPAASRFAAASHLADCDDCRSIVTQLSSAVGAASETEKREAAGAAAAVPPIEAVKTPWWKSLFGAAFAPGLLRYAAPALVLGLVGVVSFIALRSREGRAPETVYQPDVAVNTGVMAPAPSSANTETAGTTSPAAANSTTTQVEAAKDGASTTAKVGEAPGARSAELKATETDTAKADRVETVTLAKGAGSGAASGSGADNKEKKDAPADIAPAPVPPPAKAAPVEVTESQKVAREDVAARNRAPEENEVAGIERGQQAEQNRAANQMRRQEPQMPDGSTRGENRAANNRGFGELRQAPPKSERPATAAKRGRSNDKQRDGADEDDVVRVETRSVAGHRFRRDGNAWVDVNYKSSMSMTGVRRGTEGYRALVADIPELGRIAEQLGGAVIVVVKGRAYSVR